MITAVPLTKLLPSLGRCPIIMGVLNITPDSFSDGGACSTVAEATARGVRMVEEGAHIIDVGGESTRPGADPVGEEEEICRVVPIVKALADVLAVPISIDTYKAATARAALEAGASIVNDVWGLQRLPRLATVAASFGAPVVIMHNRELVDPTIDVVDDILAFFDRSLAIAREAGIGDDQIALDPGIGFGKTHEQSLVAIASIGRFRALGFPILIGSSRKRFIGQITGLADPKARVNGTIGANVVAYMDGADIFRVHDVREHVEALGVAKAIADARPAGTGTQ